MSNTGLEQRSSQPSQTEQNLSLGEVKSLIQVKKELIQAIINGAQSVQEFPELQEMFTKPFDECVFIKREMGNDYPINMIPSVFIYSNPEDAAEQHIYSSSRPISYSLSHNSLMGHEKILTTIHPILRSGKQVSTLVYNENSNNDGELNVYLGPRKPDKIIPALGILVLNSNATLLYYPFVIELPNNYTNILKENRQMLTDAELILMGNNAKIQESARQISKIQNNPQHGGSGGESGVEPSKPHVSRKEAITTELNNLKGKPKKTYEDHQKIRELEVQLSNFYTNELRKNAGNTGKSTKELLKILIRKPRSNRKKLSKNPFH